jgi:lysophospholipase L1-like esterase
VSVPKPPGAFRVILLGGSTSHGFGVADSETLDAALRALLSRQHPGRRFDVVNLGFDGYDSQCDLERLRADGLALEPDVVILHSGINDVSAARFDPPRREVIPAFRDAVARLLEQRRRGGPSFWELVKHHFYAPRVPGILRALLRVAREPPPPPLSGPPSPPAHGPDGFEENLRRISALTDPRTLLLFSTPPSSLTLPGAPPPISQAYLIVDALTTQRYRDALDERMRRVAAEEAARGRLALYVPHDVPAARFLDDCHVDAQGNRLLAVDFAEAISRLLGEAASSSRR